jgi:hypothetical protein
MAQNQRQAAGLSKSPKTVYSQDVELRLINDYIFKYVFGREETKDVLLDLVNAILEDSGWPRVRSLTLGNPTQGRSGSFFKETVLDIQAEDEHDRQFDIEIQVNSNPYFVNRSLFYWAQLYGNQLDRGLTYGRLRPVICVNILAFTIFPYLPGRHNWFMLRNAAKPDYVLTEDLVLHYIELYKPLPEAGGPGSPDSIAAQSVQQTSGQRVEQAAGLTAHPTRLAVWIEFLRREREGEDMKVLLSDDLIFQKAHEAFQWSTHDRESRELALSRERFLRDQASNLEYALEEGLAKGLEQGLEKGLEQGLEQGFSKGREEAMNKIAKAMKIRGLDSELITDVTGLDRDFVERM